MPNINKQVNSDGAWTLFVGTNLVFSELTASEADTLLHIYERTLEAQRRNRVPRR